MLQKYGKYLIIGCLALGMAAAGCENKKFEKTDDMSQYDTPYTECIANEDGTYSMYIYAAPVQYEDKGQYRKTDPELTESETEKYAYENKAGQTRIFLPERIEEAIKISDAEGNVKVRFTEIGTEFSKARLVSYKNMYGDEVTAAAYTDEKKNMTIYLYATITGIQTECQYREKVYPISVQIECSADKQENAGNGYIILKNRKKKELVISKPMAVYGENILLEGRFHCKYKEKIFQVTSKLDEEIPEGETVTSGFSINRYVNKIPDTNICSKKDKNAYLKPYALVGEHPVYGTGWNFTRFRINYYMGVRAENVIKAEYGTKLLYSTQKEAVLNMYKNEEQWSSTLMTWSDRKPETLTGLELCSRSKQTEDRWLVFDLTDFVKESVEDIEWNMESFGCVMEQEGDGFTLFASSDNLLYIPYLRIDLKERPERFDARKDVNEEIWTQEGFW